MSSIPKHIAIVMDGNGRWAKKRFLPRLVGHQQGLKALTRCVEYLVEKKTEVLTVFAFSSENWSRPKDEVSGLMGLLGQGLVKYLPELKKNGVRLHLVGNVALLQPSMQDEIWQAQLDTASNTALVLNVCFNYGGRWDMVQAAQQLAQKGILITEETLQKALALAHVPDPDLFIRTGGEQRISNFLLWQLAYTELYFTPTLWPDFGPKDIDQALTAYAARERRFGGVSSSAVTSVAAQSV
jgi:undecaprenyl diphosphate synthase